MSSTCISLYVGVIGHSSGPPGDGHCAEPPGPCMTPDQVLHTTLNL